MPSPDRGLLTGMTVGLPMLDLERAVEELAGYGFQAVEVFLGQLSPRIVPAPLYAEHAKAAADQVRALGLTVSTLNSIIGEFDPYSDQDSFQRAVDTLAGNIRMAAAMGSPRVLIWDGELDDPRRIPDAPQRLAECISQAQSRSSSPPPAVSVELHPNTFTLKHGLLHQVASTLTSVDAGICLDLCHFAVALGRDFAASLSDDLLDCVTHIHYADSDCASEQLHFPPGEGTLDLSAIGQRLAGRGLSAAWDLFGWPRPRQAMQQGMEGYRAFIARIGQQPDDPQPKGRRP